MKKIFYVLLTFLLAVACTHQNCVDGVYRYLWGNKNGYAVWIVDGNTVRQKIYNYFLYGGNEQRYPFNPKGEIWIDHAVSCEEFELTLAHELNERHLMAKFGWSYEKSHDSSLALEVGMRRKYCDICRAHEATLPKLPVTDHNHIKEIPDIPDSIKLENIYRVPLGIQDGIRIWIVDGYQVRAKIFPDFGFSGNDLVYHFIPQKEIWIDGQVSAEETAYSIAAELIERQFLANGATYDSAYGAGIDTTTRRRFKMGELAKRHPPIVLSDSLTRDSGIIDPMEK